MASRAGALVLVAVLGLSPRAWGDAQAPLVEALSIRGRVQKLRLYGPPGGRPAVVASGDGGWIHLAPLVAEFLAAQGYAVVGFDSKAYLSSFTRGDTTLRPEDVPGDLASVVERSAAGRQAPVLLAGVSEGAGLSVLAAAEPTLKARLAGVIALGLPDRNELGWRFADSVIYLTKGLPREPLFSAAEAIAGVSPLPIAAIHSRQDEYVPVAEVERVVARAGEPKRLWLIPARNHRFAGSEALLRSTLREAIAWIDGARR